MATLEELLQAINPANTYQRYIGQPFANVAGPFGRGFLGLGRPEYGSEQAYRTGQAVSNMPAAGIPAGAMKAAAQVPGLLADVMQAAKGSDELAGLLALTAYHGSPHKFSKFDASKIGTGEGAQSYGHGLYFAENPEVAKVYQRKLSDNGSFYTVDIPDKMIGKMLDWDTPLDQQNKAVVKLLQKDFGNLFQDTRYPSTLTIGSMMSRRGIPISASDMLKGYNPVYWYGIPAQEMTGQDLWHLMMRRSNGNQAEASEQIRKLGIPGIKYLDRGSRSSGQGTRNFVVFPGEEEALKMLSVE